MTARLIWATLIKKKKEKSLYLLLHIWCQFQYLSFLTRDLKNNEISWTIEDMNGAFSGLDKLRRL